MIQPSHVIGTLFVSLDRGTLSVSYTKPFDLLVEGNETGIGF